MGYYVSFDNNNKVTTQALCVKYISDYSETITQSTDETTGEITQEVKPYWICTRYATKQYVYVGMDFVTAKECAKQKRAMYTREYYQADGDEVHTIIACYTEVVPQYVSGKMWEVVITVNETDSRISYTLPTDMESLFSLENQRTYDEDGDDDAIKITLNSCSRTGNGTMIGYSSNIENIDVTRLILEYKNNDNWVSLTYISDGFYSELPSGEQTVRLKYGDYTSNQKQVV